MRNPFKDPFKRLTKHQRYILRMYRKYGGTISYQPMFANWPPLQAEEAVSVSVLVKGQRYVGMFRLRQLIDVLSEQQ